MIRECPRCGNERYEMLRSHSYCSECNYSPVYESNDASIPDWALDFVNKDEWFAKLKKLQLIVI